MNRKPIEERQTVKGNFGKGAVKSALRHWKACIMVLFLMAFLMDGSAATATYQTTQHYLERENVIGTLIAPILAEYDVDGMTWNGVLKEVDHICEE